MSNIRPEDVLPHPHSTIVRHKSYGSTHSNQHEITRSIKSNFDNGCLVQAFTIVVHADPEGSPQDQELAYLIEYSDGHIELFDQHSMSINRSSRESELIGLLRTLVYLGAGERLFYCPKRMMTQVFQQSPLLTTTVIKSKGVKSLLAHWHEFTSVNNSSHQTLPRSIFKEKEWDKLADLVNSSINNAPVVDLYSFIEIIDENDEVIAGYVGRSLKQWIFVCRRGRSAYMTFCDENNINDAYFYIVGKYKMKGFGDFIKDSVLKSSAQRLISVNQEQLIHEYDDSCHSWLFGCLIN